jgi:hypothetical protein
MMQRWAACPKSARFASDAGVFALISFQFRCQRCVFQW